MKEAIEVLDEYAYGIIDARMEGGVGSGMEGGKERREGKEGNMDLLGLYMGMRWVFFLFLSFFLCFD